MPLLYDFQRLFSHWIVIFLFLIFIHLCISFRFNIILFFFTYSSFLFLTHSYYSVQHFLSLIERDEIHSFIFQLDFFSFHFVFFFLFFSIFYFLLPNDGQRKNFLARKWKKKKRKKIFNTRDRNEKYNYSLTFSFLLTK